MSELNIDRTLDDAASKIIVCCGSGGVGKTTTAAALALRAAQRGRRVVVLTIDPAKRLAQSMGLRVLDNQPRAVALGADVPGELFAMMLDMRRTFDDMVQAHAGPARAQQILTNPFYQTVSTSFSGTQEYMAMEKLGQLAGNDQWDLIVVDTPPSRSALDFLDAPQRLSSVLDGRLIRMLTTPARVGAKGVRRLIGTSFAVFSRTVSGIIGGQLLQDAATFVQALESMFGGFRKRAAATYELLRSPGTNFVVVAAPEPDALREAGYFVTRLSRDNMPLLGMIANRTHPLLVPGLSAPMAQAGADRLSAQNPTSLAAAVLRIHADRAKAAEKEQRLLERFASVYPAVPVVRVPALPGDIHDLDGLRQIGQLLAEAI